MYEATHADDHQPIIEIVDRVGAIMAADEELELLVTFNGSATFQLYSKTTCKNGCWIAVGVRTVYSNSELPTMRFGFEEAEEWLQEIRRENSEGDY